MRIPPPFTPLSIAGDKEPIHTPCVHSTLALSVYCLLLHTEDSAIFAATVKAGGFQSCFWGWSCADLAGERDGWSKRMTVCKSRNGDTES